MRILKEYVAYGSEEIFGYLFYCPGCKRAHSVTTNPNIKNLPVWGFNENLDKPTFTPSILVRYRHPKGYTNDNPAPRDFDGEYVEDICHSFVVNGQIQYLGDCTHEFAGQTIDIPEFKYSEDDDDKYD